jgi:hypothetical protein
MNPRVPLRLQLGGMFHEHSAQDEPRGAPYGALEESGNLAMLLAMPLASSIVSTFAMPASALLSRP